MAMSSTMNSDSERTVISPHPDGDIMHLLEQFKIVLQEYKKNPGLCDIEQICKQNNISNYYMRSFK